MSTTTINNIFPGVNDAYVIALVSVVLFFWNNLFLLTKLVPHSARTTKRQEWKWRNIANSFIHSFITGCGACIW